MTFLVDSATRHAIFVLRFSRGLEEEYANEIADIFGDALGRALQGSTISDINALTQGQLNELIEKMLENAESFADNETAFSKEMIEQVIKEELQQAQFDVPSSLMEVNPREYLSISDALKDFAFNKRSEVMQMIIDARTQGQTQMEMTNNVRSLTELSARQSGILARTINNAVSSQAQFQTINQNAYLFDGYQWVATLDSRTTMICASRDGQVFEMDGPKPPAHYGCRSVIIPNVKPEYAAPGEGTRPSIGKDGVKRVRASTTYEQWLKKQPASFQDEVLGETRANLFRNSGLNLDKFVDNSGRKYNLTELQALNPLAFARTT